MALKIIILVLFFGVLIGVGIACRKHATDVNGFVLGGRNVGPWLTAFAYGTSYFSAVIFIGYAGQFGWKYGVSSTWIGRVRACPEVPPDPSRRHPQKIKFFSDGEARGN